MTSTVGDTCGVLPLPFERGPRALRPNDRQAGYHGRWQPWFELTYLLQFVF